MGATDAVLQFVCAVLVVAIPAGILTVYGPPRRVRVIGVVVAGLVGAAGSIAIDVVFSSPVDVPGRTLDAAFTGAIVATVAILASKRLGTLGGAVFGATWGLLVFHAVFAAVVGSVPSVVQTVFGAVDYAGVLATHVAAAASLLTLYALPVPPRDHAQPPITATLARSLCALALITVGASAWMVGVERVVNVSTGRTLGNAVAGLVLGAVVWVLIERIAGRPFVPAAIVRGCVVGWASIGLGVAFLSPMALVTSTVIATASGAAIVVRARDSADPNRRGAIGVIIATSTGGVVLALLADGFGLAATGSTALVVGQLSAVLAIALGAAALGGLCWVCAAGAIVVSERRREAETR